MRITPRPCGISERRSSIDQSFKNHPFSQTLLASILQTKLQILGLDYSTDAKPPVQGSYKNKLVSFWTMSEDEILKIIKSAPNKLCDLDPIPTSLVLKYITVPLTPITNIENYSLQEGSFPSCFKTAHVTPLLKSGFSHTSTQGNSGLK